MRHALKEGLEQAGETYLPKVRHVQRRNSPALWDPVQTFDFIERKVHIAKRLKYFLEEQLDQLCPNTIRQVTPPPNFSHPVVSSSSSLPAEWSDIRRNHGSRLFLPCATFQFLLTG
uniref:Uncharacterized protein n=1 Tax=Hanusia phi TaxID=3032 RepID=A0A7S0DZT4_9CRYP|mmetsp:Transcript_13630/g.31366  ORF Transcript_13630/g.31366 Transcript_13630/m.31366 type:complete len:116 (+) Transcript_13630:403-750(+)